ncbi:hypothetical protein VTN49DRAFT_2606 [Thermomyces lanuginosus]|uniref:uncharacterized protein n=1 Tax=Thermomyces lanuginosus TaxID=5541 RepID=UPI003741F8F2
MGVHHITSVEDLWRHDGKVPSHLPSQYMSRVRFEQIQQFLKVSDPREDGERKRSNSKEWWNHRRFHDGKLVVCAWCKHKGTKVKGRVPRSTSGCEECGKVSLCLKSKCWEEFHGLQ